MRRQDSRSLCGVSLFSFNDDEASLNHTTVACQLGGAEERAQKPTGHGAFATYGRVVRMTHAAPGAAGVLPPAMVRSREGLKSAAPRRSTAEARLRRNVCLELEL